MQAEGAVRGLHHGPPDERSRSPIAHNKSSNYFAGHPRVTRSLETRCTMPRTNFIWAWRFGMQRAARTPLALSPSRRSSLARAIHIYMYDRPPVSDRGLIWLISCWEALRLTAARSRVQQCGFVFAECRQLAPFCAGVATRQTGGEIIESYGLSEPHMSHL